MEIKMFTAISTMEPSGHGSGFFPTEKDADRGSTNALPKSHSIFNQKSDIIELSPTAREKLAQYPIIRKPPSVKPGLFEV
jgi:hypothetical protein